MPRKEFLRDGSRALDFVVWLLRLKKGGPLKAEQVVRGAGNRMSVYKSSDGEPVTNVLTSRPERKFTVHFPKSLSRRAARFPKRENIEEGQ